MHEEDCMRPYIPYLLLVITTSTSLAMHNWHLSESWFPQNAKNLKHTLFELKAHAHDLYNAQIQHTTVKAIIVPHAALSYSGTVAAAVYSLVDASVDRVIILAPDHSGRTNGIAVPSFDTYQLPIGKLTVDTNSIQSLLKNDYFKVNNEVFSSEHSLEIQLPFISYFTKQVKIVPLIVGSITCDQAENIAQSLQKIIDKNSLVIVSTDFVHYGQRFGFTPFKDHKRLRMRGLNSQAVELIENGKPRPFADFIEKTGATICGANPLKLLLTLLDMQVFGYVEPRFIAYDTSHRPASFEELVADVDDAVGEVSYVGMLFTSQKLSLLPITSQLTQHEKRSIAHEAYDILGSLFEKNNIDQSLYYPIRSFGVTRKHPAFVTIEKHMGRHNKELRGCIGRTATIEPLYKTVARVTEDAALHDSRFSPVTKEELPSLSLKVAVLSEPKEIDSYQKITLGHDGIILQQNGASALFLPEVPLEFGWNLPQTLEQLTIKAGLPSGSWKDKKTEFKIFRTLDI